MNKYECKDLGQMKKENFMQDIGSKVKFTFKRLITSHIVKTGHPAL
jgi:hypothetical protein